MKKNLFVIACCAPFFLTAQQLVQSQFNSGSVENNQSTYIIGEVFNQTYSLGTMTISESILEGITVTSTLATENFKVSFTKVYPNPVTQKIFYLETAINSKAYLYNTAGQLVKTVQLKKGKNTIRAPELHSGIFILKTESDFTTKIIIQ